MTGATEADRPAQLSLAAAYPHLNPKAAAAADRFLAACETLTDGSHTALKMFAVTNLFLWHLDAFESHDDPVVRFVAAFTEAAELLEAASRLGVSATHFPHRQANAGDDEFVGDLFSTVYAGYTDDDYFDHSSRVLAARLQANDIAPAEMFVGKVVVDAGCGGGKFTHAMARFGATRVIGIDIGEGAVRYARMQAGKTDYGDRLEYRVGSVLDLPLENGVADLVWSNSVVHLVDDHRRAIEEMARVLKPGGSLYIYVDGRFGLYELLLRTVYRACRSVPPTLVRAYLESLGVSPGRISWMMPCFFAPYKSIPRDELVTLLQECGFRNLRQLTRGIDIDQIEQVSAGLPHAEEKYGEAQLKFLATKAA